MKFLVTWTTQGETYTDVMTDKIIKSWAREISERPWKNIGLKNALVLLMESYPNFRCQKFNKPLLLCVETCANEDNIPIQFCTCGGK